MITDLRGLRLTARIELAQHVGRNRHRLAEHHLADVDGDVASPR